MRIAVLAHNLRVAGGKSVGINVVRILLKMASNHEYLFFLPDQPEYRDLEFGNHGVVFFKHKNYLQRYFFDKIILRKKIIEFKPNAVLGLGNIGLSSLGVKQVILIHNPNLVRERPANVGLLNWFLQSVQVCQLKKVLRETDVVLCQTRIMAAAVKSKFNYNGRISILPNVLSSKVCHGDTSPCPKILRDLENKFVLFQLSNYYAHKNFALTLKLFSEFRKELEDIVVITTLEKEQGKGARKFLDEIEERNLQDQIVNVGRIPQEELAGYYRNIDGIFFPTLLESSSGSYLEAIYFGVPIVTSDFDFAHEACGAAAIYFDPHSTSSAFRAVKRLQNDQKLRDDLVQYAMTRRDALSKTWDEVAPVIFKALECS